MPKSPFRNYTVEQIFAREASSYLIMTEYKVFDVNGKFLFDKKSADRYFKKIVKELVDVLLNSKNRKEKLNAKRVLNSLRIEPFRLH